MTQQSKKSNPLNLPNIPSPTYQEELESVLKIVSKLKYHFPVIKEFLTKDELELIRKYAK